MKLKNLIPLSLMILASLTLSAHAKDMVLDASKSNVVWTGTKVGGSHTGEIKFSKGKFKTKSGKIIGGEFTVDMSTMTTTDLTGDWAKKLIGHLKSDDFFSVAKHKHAKFTIDTVRETKKGKIILGGKLTIKGKSHPAQLLGDIKVKNGSLTGSGRLEFDRTKYDIRYGSGKFFTGLGDKLIHDKVVLEIKVFTKG